jgi:hypothetical protein
MQPEPGCVVARAVAHLPVTKQRPLSFERNLAHGSHALAAFELHQVAETIYKGGAPCVIG